MVRLFTASLNRQSEQEANRQITEIRSRFAALLDDCEEACRELTRNGTVSRYMIDTTTVAGRFSSGVLGYFKESIRTGGHDLVPNRSIPGTE